MGYFVVLLAMLAGTWYVLSGYETSFFLVSGGISALVVGALAFKMQLHRKRAVPAVINYYSPIYFLWLFKEIVKSSLVVTARVWQVEPDISPQTSWVSMKQTSDVGRATLANSITLTPGTVSLDAREDSVRVHALLHGDLVQLQKGAMDGKVKKLVQRAG